MVDYAQGDIVGIKFPFVNDPNDGKERPAMVISNKLSNDSDADVILACITSTIRVTQFSYMLDNNDLSTSLPLNSEVRCNKLMTLQKNKIIRKISALNPSKIDDMLSYVYKSIKR